MQKHTQKHMCSGDFQDRETNTTPSVLIQISSTPHMPLALPKSLKSTIPQPKSLKKSIKNLCSSVDLTMAPSETPSETAIGTFQDHILDLGTALELPGFPHSTLQCTPRLKKR